MKTMARGGPRTRRVIGTGGTLGACPQYEYLDRTPAPRGGSQRQVVLGSFLTSCVVCERWRACAWFSSSSSLCEGHFGGAYVLYRTRTPK